MSLVSGIIPRNRHHDMLERSHISLYGLIIVRSDLALTLE